MSDAGDAQDVEFLRAERDLYQRLLELGGHDRLDALLDEALALVTELAGAKKGYLAAETAAGEVAKLRGIAEDEAGAIKAELSRGIIAEALRSGKTVNTASARSDPRFATRESVQAQRLEAVLCAPIGGAAVLYLAGRDRSGPFGGREQRLVETFARGIVPFVERLRRDEAVGDRTILVRSKLNADAIVGRSAALAKALEVAVVAASSDLPVLLLGESGVGKSAFARMIHESGKRARGPFVELNCAALPETLAESELFGAEKGAHSTANRRIPGKIAAAEGGTLLLDEVGELPPSIQAKLLGVLQSKRYFALGATVEQTADVRIIAATNADLPALVAQKKFREDLYYRLHVLTARLPALRERREDVPILADGFATREGGPPLSSVARAALTATDWPGNVRELLATVQRGAAFARAEGAAHVEPRHLFPERTHAPATTTANAAPTFAEGTRRFQQQFLREALERADGNVSEASRQLDLSRSRLYELLRDHDLLRGKGRG